MKSILIVLAVMVVLCGHLRALSLAPLTWAMRLEHARLVVVGHLAKHRDGWTIEVTTVLKGPDDLEIVRPKRPPRYIRGERPLVLYFEAKQPSVRHDRITMLMLVEKGTEPWNMVHMLKDPAPQTDLTRHPESKDVVEVLGYLYDSYSVSVPGSPELEEVLARRHWTQFPWQERRKMVIQSRQEPGRGQRLQVHSIQPSTTRDPIIRGHIENADTGWIERFPESVTITIEPSPRKQLGALSDAQAAAYLRGRLKSEDPQIVCAAIAALARMHDFDSVPDVIALLNAEDRYVAFAAREFLGWSGDPRAVTPLCEDLAKYAPVADRHRFSYASAKALGDLGDPRAAPYLEAALAHGVHSAFSSLRSCGRKESIDAILQSGALASREMSYYASLGLTRMGGLVRRSNKPVEDWMDWQSNDPMPPELVAKWNAWWEENRDTFELVRSYHQAFALKRRADAQVGLAKAARERAERRKVFFTIVAIILLIEAVLWWFSVFKPRKAT